METTPENVRYEQTKASPLTSESLAMLYKTLTDSGFGSLGAGVKNHKGQYVTVNLTFKTHEEVVDFCKRLKK